MTDSNGGVAYASAATIATLPDRVDAYGPNPGVTDVSARSLRLFEAASERGPAPTLFAGGDLPPFTASGIDPSLLSRVPYSMRHYAAAETDRAKLLTLIEECIADPSRMARGRAQHRGLEEYEMRVNAWLRDVKVEQPPLGQADYPDAWKTPKMRAAQDAR